MPNKQLHYTAEEIDELLGVVDNLDEATTSEAGLMSAEDKAKLDSVEGGAEENVIEEVQVGGSALTPANKVVNIPADSAPTSESTNLVRSGGVYTAIQQVANALLNYYTKAQVDALLAGVHQFTYQVVAELPDASADTMYILYFVPSSDPQTQNVKDEYITIRTGSEGAYAYSWERIGSTEIDLSDYPTTEEMNAAITAAIASKADKDDDAVEGNLAKFDANGNPVDAGIAAEKVAKKGEVQTFAGNLVDTRSAGTRQGPFAFRQSGGDGVNYMRKILGRTEAFNQLVQNGNFADTSNWSAEEGISFSVSSNEAHLSMSGGAYASGYLEQIIQLHAGHKYLICFAVKCGNAGSRARILTYGGEGAETLIAWAYYSAWTNVTQVVTATKNNNSFRIYADNSLDQSVDVSVDVKNFFLVDLTLEGLGLTTADQFRALHPLPYYNYNAGVLKNNDAEGLETTGFNQWDEEWENGVYNGDTGLKEANPAYIRSKNFIPLISQGAYYYIKAPSSGVGYIRFYNANKEYLGRSASLYMTGSGVFSLPAGAAYTVFQWQGTTYNHNICINRSDASRNGIYEPYWKREIVLGLTGVTGIPEGGTEADRVTIFPNGLAGVGTAQDMFYEENGVAKAKKVMGVVDLGTLGWGLQQGYTDVFQSTNSIRSQTGNAICSKYTIKSTGGYLVDKELLISERIYIKDSTYNNQTPATFKAAMDGVMLSYELATPVVYTDLQNADGTPFEMPKNILVDNLGTEKATYPTHADGSPSAPFECDSNYSVGIANLVRRLNALENA